MADSNIFSFASLGVEKKNDDFRRYFHRKINRWDAAKNLLLVEKRQEELRNYAREKRVYVKRKESFWKEEGKQEAAKKVCRISTQQNSQAQPDAHRPYYSCDQLKKMKTNEILALLAEQTRKTFNKRTRKQSLINAYLEAQGQRDN